MKKSVLLLTLLISICLQAKSQYADRKGKDFALFFAVSDYDEWQSLDSPIKNAKAIAELLEDDFGFTTQVLENPSKTQIYETLAAYNDATKYQDDSQLLVFFGGHGHKDQFNISLFAPKEAKENDILGESYIPYNRISQVVNNIPCNHILLAVDACYSGSILQPFFNFRDAGSFGTRPGEDANALQNRFIKAGIGERRWLGSHYSFYPHFGRR